jgi:hypothetical protein
MVRPLLAHILVGEPGARLSPGYAWGNSGVVGAMRRLVVFGVWCAALALGGCASDALHTGGFWAQPGKYDFLKCPDIAKLMLSTSTRERDLVSLMERADKEAVGPVINLMVYRSDLEQVRADLALLQETSRQKGCDNLVPNKK